MRTFLLSIALLCAGVAHAQILAPVMAGAASVAGSLSGSVSSAPTTANLTTAGPTDWVGCGLNSTGYSGSVNRFNGTNVLLPSGANAYTIFGSPTIAVTGGENITFTWTNGTPTTSGSAARGCYITGASLGDGFGFTAPSGTSPHTLVVYTECNAGSVYTFSATLSDGSAGPYTTGSTTCSGSGNVTQVYTLVYNSAAPAQTLAIAYTISGGGGSQQIHMLGEVLN